jgi:hypothetical protein
MKEKKEYESYYRECKNSVWDSLKKPFRMVVEAIDVRDSKNDESSQYLDIDTVRSACNEVLDFLAIRKRMWKLNNQYDCKIDCDEHGFLVDGHSFETLDEVERALKMKAFM